MYLYVVVFVLTFQISIILTYFNYQTSTNKNKEETTFQFQYLVVYTLAYFSDWLKGPYIYALYESYGNTERDIAILFVIGFFTSGLSGPVIGSIADKFGRKKMSMLYFVIYILAVLCKCSHKYQFLALGRILSGIGTSILTTTLESWMVYEHRRREYSQELLDDTFGKATLCNSVSAVVAGLLSQVFADHFGYLSPFLISIIPLTTGLLCSWKWWSDDQPDGGVQIGFKNGLKAMTPNLWFLGLSQALFSGAMYIFVFLWTPSLEISREPIPFGLVFSSFMTMVTIGSGLFKYVAHRVEQLPFVIFGLALFSTMVTIGTLGNGPVVFVSFLIFELSCGLMFPTYGSLRSLYIPEEHRTTIMNIYRIPLNIFVVIILINKQFMSLEVAFGICCGAYVLGIILWSKFTPKTEQMYSQVRQQDEHLDEHFDERQDEDFVQKVSLL